MKDCQPKPEEQPAPSAPHLTLEQYYDNLVKTTKDMEYIMEMIQTLFAALDIHTLDLDRKRAEMMLAHQAYTERAMCENLAKFKKREETKQAHRQELLEHWGNPKQWLIKVADPTVIKNMTGDHAREALLVSAEKLQKQ